MRKTGDIYRNACWDTARRVHDGDEHGRQYLHADNGIEEVGPASALLQPHEHQGDTGLDQCHGPRRRYLGHHGQWRDPGDGVKGHDLAVGRQDGRDGGDYQGHIDEA